jgi:plastocyanin domain-containing protein
MENENNSNEEGLNGNQKSFLKFLAVFTIVLMAIFIFKFYGANIIPSSASGNVVASTGEVQVVKMHVEGSQYVMEPSSFKVGVPVRIEADITRMPGCSKSIVISEFNIRKSLSASNNVIEFTPTKAGTFNIACSMNMYRGTFTVLDANGAKSNYVQQAPSSGTGGSCGASGGGCGCGG